jgi:Fur family transcriptional regulator, ferric uptake regulator
MNTATHQRRTRQRQVILEELRKLTSHPTAVELYEVTRRRIPKISLGTVYRNLELLARGGRIQKLTFGNAEARFDGNPARHCHIRCVQCGRVDDIPSPAVDLLEGVKDACDGYCVLGCRVEFQGICPHCGGSQGDFSPSTVVQEKEPC